MDGLPEEGKLRGTWIAFAEKVVAEKRPLRNVRDSNEKVEAARSKPEIFAEFRKKNARAFRGFIAPESNICLVYPSDAADQLTGGATGRPRSTRDRLHTTRYVYTRSVTLKHEQDTYIQR